MCAYRKTDKGPLRFCFPCSASGFLSASLVHLPMPSSALSPSTSPPDSSAPKTESPSFDPAGDPPPYPLLVLLLLTSCLPFSRLHLPLPRLLHLCLDLEGTVEVGLCPLRCCFCFSRLFFSVQLSLRSWGQSPPSRPSHTCSHDKLPSLPALILPLREVAGVDGPSRVQSSLSILVSMPRWKNV